ncbi:MAG: lysophospholipid acyltransferase family protein [Alphaproteobacteria bacterium]|nr:MAG: hypothetical protein B6I23_01495 [Rickettsiaceae bacterium 4572_127]
MPALPPFFAILFSLFPLFVWWVKQYNHLMIIAGISFFSITAGMLFPSFPWLAFILGGGFLFLPNKKTAHPHLSMKFKNRWIKFPAEAIGIWILYTFFRVLPLKTASELGEKIGKFAGEKIKKRTKLALKNLKYTLPNETKNHKKIIETMWGNFGRTAGELPHLKELVKKTKYENISVLKKLKGKPYLIAVFHLNSLGLISHCFKKANQEACLIIRQANNPLTEIFLQKAFGSDLSNLNFLPKGRDGIIQAVQMLKKNIPVAIATDLHFKDGEDLLFLGKPAKTSNVIVKLAEKFNCPIVCIKVTRENELDHKVVIDEPIYPDGNTNKIMQKINDILGNWIKKYPSQWFWINNRWNL